MSKIIVSILLTLFPGPGAGHLYLRKYKKGVLIIVTTIVISALYFIISLGSISPDTISDMAKIRDEILKQQDPNKIMALYDQFGKLIYPAFSVFFNYFAIALAAIWAYAVVDVLNISKSMLPPADHHNIA
jgi:TM2 domain-containing membrane protein YozV